MAEQACPFMQDLSIGGDAAPPGRFQVRWGYCGFAGAIAGSPGLLWVQCMPIGIGPI